MLGDYSHFEDFADISVQFGYVTFFSVAFPLVPLLCLLANVVKIRADAYRLCHLTRRPSPRRASGIGVWLEVQRTMARVALLRTVFTLHCPRSKFIRGFPRVRPMRMSLVCTSELSMP